MVDENGVVVKPVSVKQDGNTTEIEIHIEKPVEPEQEQTAAEAAQDKPRKSLSEVLYRQLDILEREQAKVTAIDGSDANTRAVRTERLEFARQITETAKAIITIKRRNTK